MGPRRQMRVPKEDREPILVPCEGSGHPAHFGSMCQVCGETVVVGEDGRARPHQRVDVIAQINRGDYG